MNYLNQSSNTQSIPTYFIFKVKNEAADGT